MQETQVWSLDWDDPLEKEMATHSSILACSIPWTEEPGGLQFMVSQSVGHDWSDLALIHPMLRNNTEKYCCNAKIPAQLFIWTTVLKKMTSTILQYDFMAHPSATFY